MSRAVKSHEVVGLEVVEEEEEEDDDDDDDDEDDGGLIGAELNPMEHSSFDIQLARDKTCTTRCMRSALSGVLMRKKKYLF